MEYVTQHAEELHRVWETERPSELRLEGITVIGRADVILDHEGGTLTALAILDYKTSTSGGAIHDLQLQVYADAGRREGLEVRGAYIHDLKAHQRLTVDEGRPRYRCGGEHRSGGGSTAPCPGLHTFARRPMPNLRGPHRVRSGQALSPIPAVGCSPAFSFAYILDHMASTSPTESHEVYPNAPLALVAAEIRFPESTTDRTLPMTLLRIFRDALGDEWVIETRKMQQASVTIGPAGMVPQALTSVSVPRFTVRDRTLAVALTEDSMTIETTRYHHYPTFRSVLAKAAAAAAEVLTPDGVARIGLRYIDEIRVPGFLQEGLAEWHEWLNASLLAPDLLGMAEEGYKSAGWEGLVQYETGPNQKLVLRYGARSGYVVNPTGPLRRPHPPASGPLFFLDFDCFWEPEDIPEFDVDAVMTTWDRLRTPIRTLFDHLITDKLRAQFRKEAARA